MFLSFITANTNLFGRTLVIIHNHVLLPIFFLENYVEHIATASFNILAQGQLSILMLRKRSSFSAQLRWWVFSILEVFELTTANSKQMFILKKKEEKTRTDNRGMCLFTFQSATSAPQALMRTFQSHSPILQPMLHWHCRFDLYVSCDIALYVRLVSYVSFVLNCFDICLATLIVSIESNHLKGGALYVL